MPAPESRLTTVLPRGYCLRSPLLLTSGVWQLPDALRRPPVDISRLGAVITTGITREPRPGNPGVRIRPIATGWMNSKGLRNPGIVEFAARDLPLLLETGVPVLVNIVGNSAAEFAELVQTIEASVDSAERLLGYELNLSCPNVDHRMFATDCALTGETVRACRGVTDRLVVAKLSPNVTEMRPIAAEAAAAGADAVTIGNTFNAIDIDVATRRSHFFRDSAGLSGAGIRPLVLYHVVQVRRELPELCILGSGGIVDIDSSLQYLIAGANVLLLGSAIFDNRNVANEIHAGLTEYAAEHELTNIAELVGTFESRTGG